MAFTRSNFSVAAHDFKRETYSAALVGPEAVRHADLIKRAGYRVTVADDGSAASQLFVGEPVDIIVLDFALTGRPPEAVLLFSRRTSADAPVIALVPADTDDGYRRAFLAGARDVLPTPSRGEDLLAAIDVAIEPRALAEVIERLRGDDDDDDDALLSDETPASSAKTTVEVERVRREYEERVRTLEDDLDSFRRQALDAVTERDRLVESRANARRRLAEVKKELKERQAHLTMTEQACEALQRKLKDARDHRRHLESKYKRLEKHLKGDKAAAARGSIDRSITLAPDEVIDALADGFVDPEEALRVRAVDEQRLEQLEAAYEKFQESEARIKDLEAQLEAARAATNISGAPEGTPSEEEQRKQKDLEEEIALRLRLEVQVADLERELGAHKSQGQRIADLEAQLAASEALLHQLDDALGDDEAAAQAARALILEQEAHAETLGKLDAALVERDGLKARLREAEREAADAFTRLDELDPLIGEVEQVRLELHAERLRHAATRRLLDQVADVDENAAPAELLKAQREEERLQRELDEERRKRGDLESDLKQARSQIKRLSSEQEQMRMTIAALATDVSRDVPPGEVSGVFLTSRNENGDEEITHATATPRPVTGAGAALAGGADLAQDQVRGGEQQRD